MLKPFSRSTLGTESLVKEENQPFSFESLYNKFFSLEVPAGMMGRYKVDNVMTDEPRKVLMDLADHFLSAPSLAPLRAETPSNPRRLRCSHIV